MNVYKLVEVNHCEKEKTGIDIPVAINFFNRPDTLAKMFDVIREVRPSYLFLIADGPRINVESDANNTKACRDIVENVDWSCKLYHLYADTNQGLFVTYFEAMSLVFTVVDRCVFLEDDLVVSESFFPFCKELLEKYENDLRIHFITGFNTVGVYDRPDGDYFFSGEGSIWGYALWKRTFDSMNLKFRNNPYAIDCAKRLAHQRKRGYEKRIQKTVNNPMWEGHIPHVEFYKNLLRFTENQLYIVPTKNMVSNIGFSSGGVHTADNINKLPRATQKLFDTPTYVYDFPLHHPEFVICDLQYENYVNKVLAWNAPVTQFFRRVEALLRHLRYGDFKRIATKIKGLFIRDTSI